jgi:flagellar assembly protein FliH
LCWLAVAEMTSLSRIIKSNGPESAEIGTYDFRPIKQALSAQKQDESAAGFVPLSIFDTSDLNGEYVRDYQEQQEVEQPPCVTLTEDALQKHLSDSFERGLTEGKNLAERGLLHVFKVLRTAAEDVHALREKVLRESEDEILELVLLVARKVIKQEVAMDRTILFNTLKGVLELTPERDEMTLRLNPDDYAMITGAHAEYFRNELQTECMSIKADSLISHGECQLDSHMGMIDATVEAQLDEIFRRMKEERTRLVAAE